jgi:hypothetical protein
MARRDAGDTRCDGLQPGEQRLGAERGKGIAALEVQGGIIPA